MRLCIIHVHVERFGCRVDLVVKLVRPGPDNLLEIVIAEFAIVKRIVAGVDGIALIQRYPLNHPRSGRLITWIVLPKRNVSAVGNAGLNRPLIVDFRGRENSSLRIVVESINERMTRHEMVRRELRFNVRFGNDATDTYIHSPENLRNVDVEIDHRHIEAVIIVVLEKLIAKEAARNHESVIEPIDPGDAKSPVDVISLELVRHALDVENELVLLEAVWTQVVNQRKICVRISRCVR